MGNRENLRFRLNGKGRDPGDRLTIQKDPLPTRSPDLGA